MFEILTHHFSFMVFKNFQTFETMVRDRSCSSATLKKKKKEKKIRFTLGI